MRFHIHWPRTQEVHGAHEYRVCRCGARSTVKVRSGYSPIPGDWPRSREGWSR